MTTDTIITAGLAAMADGDAENMHSTFREWMEGFSCVGEKATRTITYQAWPDCSDSIPMYSLAQLAFELRDKAVRQDHTKYRDIRYDLGRQVQDNYSSYWGCDYIKAEHWIIAAIAALEGD